MPETHPDPAGADDRMMRCAKRSDGRSFSPTEPRRRRKLGDVAARSTTSASTGWTTAARSCSPGASPPTGALRSSTTPPRRTTARCRPTAARACCGPLRHQGRRAAVAEVHRGGRLRRWPARGRHDHAHLRRHLGRLARLARPDLLRVHLRVARAGEPLRHRAVHPAARSAGDRGRLRPGGAPRLHPALARRRRASRSRRSSKAEDAWGNPARGYEGTVRFEGDGFARPARAVTRSPPPTRACTASPARSPERGRAPAGRARRGAGRVSATSNPLVAPEEMLVTRVYWAELHGQSEETVGTNTAEDYHRFARDYGCVDVVGHQGNDFQVTEENWAEFTAARAGVHRAGALRGAARATSGRATPPGEATTTSTTAPPASRSSAPATR
jgi:hypothetical protein